MALIKKSEYLQLLKQFQITPNFWCSEEYFSKARLQERKDGNWVYICDPAAGITVFPPINRNLGTCPIRPERAWDRKFWSDFPEYFPGRFYRPKFLDLEYIYDPKSFLNMEGEQWAVFRKNCRKFPARHPDCLYVEPGPEHKQPILDLTKDWLGDKEPQDFEVMISYLLYGENRRILMGDGLIYGINVWDENWNRINFRFCICKPGSYYISEYMRFLFYTDLAIIGKEKLVNDGGVLDNPDLNFFKDKLNPVKIRQIFSWIKEK